VVRPGLLACTLASCCALAQAVGAEATHVATSERAFHYTLRTGETLTDVARLFRVPVGDLMEINRIVDPDRLAVGRRIVVPNAFARKAAALRAERAELLDRRREVERNAARLEETLAATRLDVRRLEGERAALADALAATVPWRLAAMLLGVLSLGALAWAFTARAERVALDGRLRRMKADLAALATAKERYREAVAQLELRYQKLHAGTGNATREVADGTKRLARAFEQGAAQLERGLAELRAERGREEHRHPSERRTRDLVLHPVREWLARHRLKYRVP
jgi:murein DD-endopeptidase MepM/ murein hydrolase activator NlpD